MSWPRRHQQQQQQRKTTTCCHLCNSSIEVESRCSDFECRHRLCSNCVAVSNGRPVCPTCSPSDLRPRSSSFPTLTLDQVTRMYSVDPDAVHLKTPITPKIIDDDVRCFADIDEAVDGEDCCDAKVVVKSNGKVVKDEGQGRRRGSSPNPRDDVGPSVTK